MKHLLDVTVYYGIDNSFSGLFPHVAQVC